MEIPLDMVCFIEKNLQIFSTFNHMFWSLQIITKSYAGILLLALL